MAVLFVSKVAILRALHMVTVCEVRKISTCEIFERINKEILRQNLWVVGR